MSKNILDPTLIANIDQSFAGARDFNSMMKAQIRNLRANHDGLTDAELIYVLFDGLLEILEKENAVMALIGMYLEHE